MPSGADSTGRAEGSGCGAVAVTWSTPSSVAVSPGNLDALPCSSNIPGVVGPPPRASGPWVHPVMKPLGRVLKDALTDVLQVLLQPQGILSDISRSASSGWSTPPPCGSGSGWPKATARSPTLSGPPPEGLFHQTARKATGVPH